MRIWTVASALIERSNAPGVVDGGGRGSVLLVRNLRRNGTTDWTPPGGVVDEGEQVLDGLEREILEETGLVVAGWSGMLYEIRAEAPDMGWDLRVEVHRAAEVRGDLNVGEDPDGIVIGSTWAGATDCERLLDGGHPWVREPLLEWMQQRWDRPRSFRYAITGSSIEEITVTRRS